MSPRGCPVGRGGRGGQEGDCRSVIAEDLPETGEAGRRVLERT